MHLQDCSALAGCSLFAELTPSERDYALGFSRPCRYAAREVIWWIGDAADALYVIMTGYVKGTRLAPDGTESILCITGPGEAFGELSVLESGTRLATVTAIEPTEVVVLSREHLQTLIALSPKFSTNLLEMMAARLRILTTRYELSSSMPSSVRLAEALLMLARKYGHAVDEQTILIPIRFSQRDIGNFAGIARENVNKLLRRWSKVGLVRHNDGRVTITNVRGLEKVASNAHPEKTGVRARKGAWRA